jgi:general secretion pathway protein F
MWAERVKTRTSRRGAGRRSRDARMTAPTFAYQAANREGQVERGRLDATTREAAMRTLAERGLFPLELTAVQASSRGAKIPAAELALTLRILADLVDSGLALGRALQTLETLAPARVAAILPAVRQSVREGRSLAHALEESRAQMPEVLLGVLRAGERGSGLAAAIRQAALLSEESAAARAALRSALAYPILLATFGTGAVCLLVGVVLPRFAAILADLGQSLPASTRFVLRAGVIAGGAALPLVIVLAVLLLAQRTWVGTPDGRRRWDALLLRLPLFGAPRMASASANLCAALSALLESGVPLVPAMGSAARATGNAELVARVARARADVEHGGRLSMALAAHEATSPVVYRLARAGEESGRLASMLGHAARIERERAVRQMQTMVRLVEPILIVAFGGMVALVAAALLQALYSVRPGA